MTDLTVPGGILSHPPVTWHRTGGVGMFGEQSSHDIDLNVRKAYFPVAADAIRTLSY